MAMTTEWPVNTDVGCGHCKKLAPALSEAAEKIKEVDPNIAFAKVRESRQKWHSQKRAYLSSFYTVRGTCFFVVVVSLEELGSYEQSFSNYEHTLSIR